MTLDEFGLNASNLVAGFAGGVVHAFAFKQREPVAVVGSIMTGTLTANFLAPAAAHYVGGWVGNGGSAFIVGLSAMAIVQGIVNAVKDRLKSPAKEKAE